jgi:hypothetical protein
MNITVHIDRLILEGISLAHSQRPRLQATVEAELVRLLATNGLASNLQTHGSWPSLTAAPIELQNTNEPIQLGKQIAQAVYRGIGK